MHTTTYKNAKDVPAPEKTFCCARLMQITISENRLLCVADACWAPCTVSAPSMWKGWSALEVGGGTGTVHRAAERGPMQELSRL